MLIGPLGLYDVVHGLVGRCAQKMGFLGTLNYAKNLFLVMGSIKYYKHMENFNMQICILKFFY